MSATQIHLQEEAARANGHAPHVDDVPLTPRHAGIVARIIKALAESSERAARFFVMLVACAMFEALMLARTEPSEYRIAVPVLFVLLVVWPMWWRTMFPKGAAS